MGLGSSLFSARKKSGLSQEEVAEKLELPKNEEVLMMLDLGYAAEDGKPLPNHASRKPLSGTVTYL